MQEQVAVDFLTVKDQLQLKNEGGKKWIFDTIRKKWLVLQPEEWVRQLIVCYFLQEKKYNRNWVSVERKIKGHNLNRRLDILVYDAATQPWMLVEVKAPNVPITMAVFRQIAMYNLPLKVPYLLVSNGWQTYCCLMHYDTSTWTFLSEIPDQIY